MSRGRSLKRRARDLALHLRALHGVQASCTSLKWTLPLQIELSGQPGAFQPGCTDTFHLPHAAIGALTMCTLSRECSADSPGHGWAVRQVAVTQRRRGEAVAPVDTFWFCATIGPDSARVQEAAELVEASAQRAHGGDDAPVMYTIRVFTSDVKGAT